MESTEPATIIWLDSSSMFHIVGFYILLYSIGVDSFYQITRVAVVQLLKSSAEDVRVNLPWVIIRQTYSDVFGYYGELRNVIILPLRSWAG